MTIHRLRPFLNVGLGKIGRLRSLDACAVEQRVLEPAHTQRISPAICLPGQLDLATKVIDGGNLKNSLSYLAGTEVHHGDVVEYVVKDAFVHRGGADLWGARLLSSRVKLSQLLDSTCHDVASAAYCMDSISRERFGHWLTDACTTALLAGEGQLPVIDVRSDWPHAVAYAKAFDLTETQGPMLVRRLSVYSDLAQSRLKRMRYLQLRDRMGTASAKSSDRHIYLRRGATGDRRMLNNEAALIERLETRGFQTVDVKDMDLDQIRDALAGASTIVSLDGSHITHIYFCAPSNAALVTIIPDDRFVDVHKHYCDCIGLTFGFIVCRRQGAGYDVSIDDLERTLDLVAARSDHVQH